MRSVIAFVASACLALAADKRLPAGEASNGAATLQAGVLDDEHLQQIFASDFGRTYVVIEVTLTPKGATPLDVKLDDFLLRSEQTGAHSGPLSAYQIGGQGGLVVTRGPQSNGRGNGWSFGGMMGGGGVTQVAPPPNSKVEAKDDRERDPLLGMLQRKILPEKSYTEPVTALLFFPLEKERPKNLSLQYTTPAGKLRFKFK